MTLDDWLDGRRPPVPDGFRSWVAEALSSAPEGYDDLQAEGAAALNRALSSVDRPRDGAFDLLVADALVTWASEAAVDLPDGEARLEDLVRSLAG